MATTPNRIDPTAEPTTQPYPSPTGSPIIPPKAVPWLGVAGAALVALQSSVQLPAALNAVISGALLLIGVLSPGWRRQ